MILGINFTALYTLKSSSRLYFLSADFSRIKHRFESNFKKTQFETNSEKSWFSKTWSKKFLEKFWFYQYREPNMILNKITWFSNLTLLEPLEDKHLIAMIFERRIEFLSRCHHRVNLTLALAEFYITHAGGLSLWSQFSCNLAYSDPFYYFWLN